MLIAQVATFIILEQICISARQCAFRNVQMLMPAMASQVVRCNKVERPQPAGEENCD